MCAKREWLKTSVVITVVAGVILNWAAVAWYYRNFTYVVQHASLATSGPVAELFGQADSFGNSLLYWLGAAQLSFFLPAVLLLSVAIFLFGMARHFVSLGASTDHFTICSTTAIVQILVSLATFSLSANRDVRFLLPLLPYFSLAVSWGTAQLRTRLVTATVIFMFLTQFAIVHGQSFGFMSSDSLYPMAPRQTGTTDRLRQLRRSSARLARTPTLRTRGQPYWNIVGDSRPWLNVNTLGYVAAKTLAAADRQHCLYSSIGGFFVTDEKAEWNRILSLYPHYYIATDPAVYPIPDDKVSRSVNQLNIPLLNKVQQSGLFKAESVLLEDPGIMIFHRDKPVKSFSQAEASAVAATGLPEGRGALFGGQFELLGALMSPATEGMELQLAWRCVSPAVLDRNVAVHFIDDSGKLLAQSDFVQDLERGRVVPGAEWVDHVFVPREKLAGASKVAIALYTPGREMLTIDRGPRDWDQRRLLLPLDETQAKTNTIK